MKKYKGYKHEGVIERNEFSKPDVKFHKDDIQVDMFSEREKKLVGRTVMFDITADQEAKNVRLLPLLLFQC